MPILQLRIVAAALLGLLAPLWWTWAVSNLIYGFFLVGGSPEHPSKVFAWSSILLPSALLGFGMGAVLSHICTSFWLRGWVLFWAALLLTTIIIGLANHIPTAGVSQLFSSVGNVTFLASSLVVPLFLSLRGRRG